MRGGFCHGLAGRLFMNKISTSPHLPVLLAVFVCGATAMVSSRADEAQAEAGVPRLNPRCEATGSKNLIRNASFECGGDWWSSLGKQTGWGGELSGLYGVIESGGAWDGRACLRIDMGPGVTPVTRFDCWPPAREVQHAPLAANMGWIGVTPGQPVTFSAYLRSSVAGTKARFLFRFAKSALDPIQNVSHDVVLSTEWTRYTFTQSALDEDMCIAVGPDMTAMPDETVACWIDAVQLESGSQATAFETLEPVEVGFQTGHYGNVYGIDEPIVMTVLANNTGTTDTSVTLRLEVEDYFGNALPPSTLSLAIPAGGQVSEPWVLELPGKGYFRARVTWTANGREHVRVVELTVIQPYAEEDSPFGLNHPATTERQLRLLSKAGLRWVRTWAVNWDWVEPTEGQVSWARTDEQLEYVTSAGMNTLVVFPNPSANWASSAPSPVKENLWFRLAYAPKDPQLLFGFLGDAVGRYQESCTHWEFLNEPLWVPDFCLPKSAGYRVADYIELLEGAYSAIKAADPGCKVIAGLSIEPKFPLGDEFIAGGGLELCDILNLHPYGGLAAPEEFIPHMKRIQDAMDAQGERGKPIWATEAAYYAVDDKPWTPWAAPPGHFSANLLLSDEKTCADCIVRQAIILLAHGVEKIFYHQPVEGPVNFGSWNIENTFLAEESVPKKSYAAISALATLLGPAPRYVADAAVPAANDNVFAYAFQSGPRSVVAAWAPGPEKPSGRIEAAPGVTAYDVMGNELPSPLSLGTSPVYFVSSSVTADALAENWFKEDT
jgi:Beta-galactosidase